MQNTARSVLKVDILSIRSSITDRRAKNALKSLDMKHEDFCNFFQYYTNFFRDIIIVIKIYLSFRTLARNIFQKKNSFKCKFRALFPFQQFLSCMSNDTNPEHFHPNLSFQEYVACHVDHLLGLTLMLSCEKQLCFTNLFVK